MGGTVAENIPKGTYEVRIVGLLGFGPRCHEYDHFSLPVMCDTADEICGTGTLWIEKRTLEEK